MIKDYKDLKIWQKGIEIVNDTYRLTGQFPKYELYGLSNQMRRSAVSIPSNIAEGYVRNHTKEYCQYLFITLGSCAELETQTIIAENLNFINHKDHEVIFDKINHLMRMLRIITKKIQH